MNRWTLTLIAGVALVTPVVAKTAKTHKSKPKPAVHQSYEDAAWGASGKKTGAKVPKKVKTGTDTLKPTVGLKDGQKPTTTKPSVKVEPVSHEKPPTKVDDGVTPGVPMDFASDSEFKAYQSDLNEKQTQIHELANQLLNKKPAKAKEGLTGVMADQSLVDEALKSDKGAAEDREALNQMIQERDTALYMMSASLVAQKKDAAAAAYLKFLASHSRPDSPMHDAAKQQLAQLGYRAE